MPIFPTPAKWPPTCVFYLAGHESGHTQFRTSNFTIQTSKFSPMAKKKPSSTETLKSVETLTHAGDKRKNIPTVEYQSVVKEDQKQPCSSIESTSHQPPTSSHLQTARPVLGLQRCSGRGMPRPSSISMVRTSRTA